VREAVKRGFRDYNTTLLMAPTPTAFADFDEMMELGWKA